MHPAKLASIRVRNVRGTRTVIKRLSEGQVRRSVFAILEDNLLCSMATLTPDNRAHINTAYFSYSDDLELYFLSHPSSLHCRNLSTNRSMAITIFSSSQKWVGPDKGLQLFGSCTQAWGRQASKAEQCYGKRFAAYASWKASLKTGDPAEEYRFYRFVVGKLKILDEKEFGVVVFVSAAVKRGPRS